MTTDGRAIERIAAALASTGAAGTFATRRTASADQLQLAVAGVGPIPLPLSAASARGLSKVARPARYGLREQTLLDRRVRDAWEIGKRHVTIDARRWRRTLDAELAQVARDLGLPAGTELRAELHNLLVYGPGQFFATHQDSEKADGMIGSLVVLLPSASRGGELVIAHHDETVRFRGAADRLVLVAFYADCRHEVRPVTAGYRAALTYNLFVDGARPVARPTGAQLEALVELVRTHFATPRPVRWPSRSAPEPPERLVYLLDHEYTQQGLSWSRLKNGDAVRAALFREVAERLDCEVVLALADVHETWSCEDDGGYDGFGYGRRRRRWRYDDLDDEQDGHGEYTLTELCDSSIELRHWLAPSGKRRVAISHEILTDEVCFTKPSVELEPFKSEHEGYTGNAGNTVDRWYHRAAVILWPRARTFAIHAKASPAWAIGAIAKSLARGAHDLARTQVRDVLPFWNDVAGGEQAAAFVDHLLHAVAAIRDAELAAALVAPLAVERVTPRVAPRWADLLARYGLAWCWNVFERWAARDERGHGSEDRATWIASLPELCAPLCDRGDKDAIEFARRLARAQWMWLDARLGRSCDSLPSSHAMRGLVDLSRAIVGSLATAELAADRELQTTIVERMTAAKGYPTSAAVAVLRVALTRRAGPLGLGPLHADCARTLSALASTPIRAPGDWSIATRIRCTCELCVRLARFLRAPERQLDWPLAKERREHVHQTITHHELPITHVTRRVGSPYVLVLTKTQTLFTREATERKAWANDLAWLKQSAGSFATTTRW